MDLNIIRQSSVFFIIILFANICMSGNKVQLKSTVMWMDKPAQVWNEATPIGNGQLGGMIYGGIKYERIKTNDDTFWSGVPTDLQKPQVAQYIPFIRKLIFEDKTKEAQYLIDSKILGVNNECYMPLADILLEINDSLPVTNYRRELDLNNAVVTITYTQNGIDFKREIFASNPDHAIVIKLSADKSHAVNLKANLVSSVRYETRIEGNQFIINGKAPSRAYPHYEGKKEAVYDERGGMRFEGRLIVKQNGGILNNNNQRIEVKNANSIQIVFVEATSYNGFNKNPFTEGKDEKELCLKKVNKIICKDFNELYQSHVQDYSRLFNRVSIDLGNSAESILPINRRIVNYKKGTDPSLTALYFQFGRYLLISSSRPGTLPANLQGIWNDDMQPAWSSNWTTNCNLEINYWPVEVSNLTECHLPLIELTRNTAVDGAKTAKNLYGARGWMAHHNLDLWLSTWPVGGSGQWAIYQVGGAWLCQHIWQHYLFTMDKQFLKDNYDLLKGASLFFIDALQKDKAGFLVTNPSVSFENTFKKPNGETGWACMGSAQDMQIVRALFENTMKAADMLNDYDFKGEIKKIYDKLPPIKISFTTGQLQEWNDDWEPENPFNGMLANGWALVESELISLRKTPELANAFRKTIEYRRPSDYYNCGSWTGAFPANFWVRLEEGDNAQQVIEKHFMQALAPNLTSNFNAGGVRDNMSWQIDGNLGITRAIAEMLLQSQDGEISLLPALSTKYPTGFVKGLRAQGACTIDIEWKDGFLIKASVTSDFGGEFTLRYKEKTLQIKLKAKEKMTVNSNLV